MWFITGYRHHAPLRRPWITALALVGYLISVVGMPLPVVVAKPGGVPFPCQHHACGCSTAAQCWKSCCCFSPRQKLAWAQAHDVTPPPALVAEVAADTADAEHDSAAHDSAAHNSTVHEPVKSCCAHRHAEHGDSEHDDSEHDETAQPDHQPADHERAAPHHCSEHEGADCEAEASVGVTLVLGIAARQCRGLGESWCLAGDALPPPVIVGWHYSWNLVEWLTPAIASLPIVEVAPPVPPPRV